MAINESLRRSSISLKLNGGEIDGKKIVKSCSLPKVMGGADGGKILDVAAKLAPLLQFPVIRVERTDVAVLEQA